MTSKRTAKERPKGRPTLVDLAAHAGVSRSTVSLVLRGSRLPARETRERVVLCGIPLGLTKRLSRRKPPALFDHRYALAPFRVAKTMNDQARLLPASREPRQAALSASCAASFNSSGGGSLP